MNNFYFKILSSFWGSLHHCPVRVLLKRRRKTERPRFCLKTITHPSTDELVSSIRGALANLFFLGKYLIKKQNAPWKQRICYSKAPLLLASIIQYSRTKCKGFNVQPAIITHCIFVQFYHVFSRGVQSKTAHGAAICAVPCAVVFIQGNTA